MDFPAMIAQEFWVLGEPRRHMSAKTGGNQAGTVQAPLSAHDDPIACFCRHEARVVCRPLVPDAAAGDRNVPMHATQVVHMRLTELRDGGGDQLDWYALGALADYEAGLD